MDNIRFNAAAIVLLLLLSSVAAIRKAPKVSRNRLFFASCITDMIFLLSDTARLILKNILQSLSPSDAFYPALNLTLVILSSATAASLILCSAFFSAYFFSVVRGRLSLPRQQFLIFAPAVLFLILIIINFFHPLLFYLSGDGAFRQLPLFFAIFGYYIAYVSVITARTWDVMQKSDRPVIIFLMALCFSSVLLQILFPQIHAVNLILSLAALLAYQSLESSFNYIDVKTGLQNETAFYAVSSTLIAAKADWECLLVILDDIPSLDNEFDSELTDNFLSLVAKFLNRISRKIAVMHVKRNTFALCYRKTNELEEDRISSLIEKRLSKPFTIASISIVHTFCCCRISYPEHYSTYEDFCSFVELASKAENRPAKKILNASELNLDTLKRKKLIQSLLTTALADESINITYQPVFNSSTQKAQGVETDFYIKDKSIAFTRAKELIEVAEETGSARQIFLYLFHSVCGTIQKAHLIEHKVSFVELPLPMSELSRSDCEKSLAEIADIYFVPHSKIRFVLPEKAIEKFSPVILKNINKLQEEGFGFTLEDFKDSFVNIKMLLGTNITSASVSMQDLEKDKDPEKITMSVKSIIDAFKKLGIQIKAKEIISNSQSVMAQIYALDFLQGDYFSPPLTQEALVKFFSMEALNA